MSRISMTEDVGKYVGDSCVFVNGELADPNTLVIKDEKISIQFDYPCDHLVFEYHHKKGFTRRQLYKAIVRGYEKIFGNEEKYGVWGHQLDDLVIDGVKYNPKKKLVTLDVGS